MGFKLTKREEKDFDCEEWTYHYNDKLIFGASRFPLMKTPVPEIMVDGATGKKSALNRPYAALWWNPEKGASAGSLIGEFLKFYRLIDGNEKYTAFCGGEKAYEGVLTLNGKGIREDISLSPYDAPSFLEQELSSGEFSVVRIGTPYVDFGLESLPNNPGSDFSPVKEAEAWMWKNGIRRMGVVAHNDISEPLSALIVKTGSVGILKGDLQPVLRDLLTF